MRKFLFVLFLCVGVVLTSCTEDESSPVGDVYGIVSDTKSGAPIRNAEVVISPSNASTVSGSDGHFEFKSLTPGQYKISVSANGYASNSRQVTIAAGQRISCDIHLTPQNNDVVMIKPTSLDFGTNELQLAATITNESDSETEWFLDLGNTPWLYAYPTTGRIGGGKTHSIVFTANRARMKEDKSSVVNISAFGDTHPLSLKCKQSVQLSSVMVVESLNVDFGEEATEQIIRIRNISETDVNWTLWGNDSGYLTMSATHGIVAPGSSQIVTISLNREELNEVLATTFKISDGTVDQPVNVIAYPTPEGATTTNKIFYTSTDGNIVEPYDPSVFGANIVSNTYEYGQGVITFDGDITSVGKFAFQECENLQSINLPNGVTTIGEQSFYKCGNIISVNVPNSVTSIGRLAFSDCSNLISINIPDGVTSIGDTAFAYCSSLTSVNIPNNVTKIESMTFFFCEGLTDVTIPNGVTSIGAMAFSYCVNLTSLIIPESVTYIGGGAFGDCTNLTSINIPEGVTAIEEQTFVSCSNLSEIVIPESMVSIGPGAFVQCSSLTSINIPKGVTTIEERAFYGCRSMTRVDCYPQTPPTLGFDEDYSEYNQFAYVSADCKIYVPDGTYDAYVNAEGWSEYKDMIVKPTSTVQSQILYTSTDGKTVTPYNTSAFLDADDNTLNIASNTYENGQGVITIDGELSKFGNEAFYNCSNLTSIHIPDGVTTIGGHVFYECQNLTSIDIPNTVTTIGERFLGVCYGLKSVVIPDSVTSLGEGTFYCCINLTSVTLGSGLTEISTWMFAGCDSLTDIVIPENITIVGNAAFSGCDKLTSVTLPSKLTSINYGAFQECISLESITIPESVTAIGDRIFYNCSSLTDIVIPENVTAIGAQVFSGCTSLTRVDCLPTTPPSIGTYTFDGVSADCKIYVPDGTYDTYITADGWVDYKDMIVNPNPTPAVQSQIFYTTTDGNIVYPFDQMVLYGENNTRLNILSNVYENGQGVITFDGELKTVGHQAFNHCGLISIIIPDGVTSIGSNAFSNNDSLTSVTLPNSVTTIGGAAFHPCSALTSVNIPDGVTSIEEHTFNGCRGLTSITIPDGVTSIGSQAFDGCI